MGAVELRPYQRRKDELSVEDGCVLWGRRVIVPPQGQAKALEMVHEGHPGASRMKSLARSFMWWLGMDGDVEDKVRACTRFQAQRKSPAPALYMQVVIYKSIALGRRLQVEVESTCGGSSEGKRVATHRACYHVSWVYSVVVREDKGRTEGGGVTC